MNVYLDQLKRIIDRLIMPQFPELESYKLDGREKNGWWYFGVVYKPKNLRGYADFEGSKDDMWNNIVTQTRRYYDATGHDEHYLLAAIGEVRDFMAEPEDNTPYPIKWWWKLNSEQDWVEKRDRNRQFYWSRRGENE